MALLVTLFLVLVNIFNNVTTNTPKAEGLTAIEAWMLACILFVFAALAEYAAILFHKMNLVIGHKKQTNQPYEVGHLPPSSPVTRWHQSNIKTIWNEIMKPRPCQ